MSEDERILILNWINQRLESFPPLSFNRRSYTIKPDDPPILFEIRNRIIQREKLENNAKEPLLGDFIGVVLPGGHIHPHKDVNKGCLIHTRFNVFIQLPKKGCAMYYEHEIVDAHEGHYTRCNSGNDIHYSDVNEDTIPRIVLSYGFLC